LNLTIPRRSITRAPGALAELAAAVASGSLLRGPQIGAFEAAMAARLGVAGCVAFCSGRMALVEVLDAIGDSGRSEVIFPAYTMESLPQLVRERGLIPRYADIDPETMQLRADEVERLLSDKTRAVIATHLFGTACDIAAITALCRANGTAVVEDCAHSLGGTFDGAPVGTFGDAGFFSFEIAKHVNTFGGSVVASNDAALLGRLRGRVAADPADGARRRQLLSKVAATFAEAALSHPLPYTALVARRLDRPDSGGGLIAAYKRMKGSVRARSLAWTAYQARLGLRQLSRYDATLAARVRAGEHLESALSGVCGFQSSLPGADRTWYMAVARVDDAAHAARALRAAGVDCGVGEELMQHCPRQDPGNSDRYPGTEAVLATALQLPLHPGLSVAQAGELVQRIRRALS